MTPSLYVPGTLASTETVLVDVGTGFYVEKTPMGAQKFYKAKVEELGKNLVELEKIVSGKQGNLNVVEDGESEVLPSCGIRGYDVELREALLKTDDMDIVLRQRVMLENQKGGTDSE